MRTNYRIAKVTNSYVYIIDECSDNEMSITNAAEEVVKQLYKKYGNRVFIYKDSMGIIDRLDHEHGEFIGFLPGAGNLGILEINEKELNDL